ncbi:MAG: DUF2723 domain-containing protein, partial [Candidatus Eisenbacteria bacterium]
MSRRSNFDMGLLLGGRSGRQAPRHKAMAVPPARSRAPCVSPVTAACGPGWYRRRPIDARLDGRTDRCPGVIVTRSRPTPNRTGRPAPRVPGRPVAQAPPAPSPPDGASWIASAALATALFACYLGFAPPVSGDKDASEFALALATGGVIHPTGYPIYTMLGHVFVRLLHGMGASFPFAANAWASLGGGVAMFFYHRLALRFIPPRAGRSRLEPYLLAAVPVLLLAFNPVWMVECTSVEVHSWQLAWLFGTSLCFIGTI